MGSGAEGWVDVWNATDVLGCDFDGGGKDVVSVVPGISSAFNRKVILRLMGGAGSE